MLTTLDAIAYVPSWIWDTIAGVLLVLTANAMGYMAAKREDIPLHHAATLEMLTKAIQVRIFVVLGCLVVIIAL
jgi:hypothetical protein